ncbi:MAG: RNA methyltransferase [Fibrobacter sp.]|nr:RNA methyltransferase [Fibrobacter sp.]
MAEASKKDISDKNSALEKRIKKHVIGKPHRFIAVAPLGFEETLAEELKYIGVERVADINVADINVAGDGKVEFTAKITEAWKAVAYSRIANRILMEIASFKAENFGQLEKGTAAVPWELFLGKCANLELHVNCKHSRLYHSGAIEERVATIIAKALTGSNSDSYPQNLYINLQDDRCTLWLDLAGEELYKRGHERFVAEAPLKETIAAAMIFEACRLQVPGSRLQASGDNTASTTPQSERCERPHTSKRSDLITFIDPMAGSGTFSLEAAYIANGLIPGKCRDFALKHQPAFKEGTWNFILKGAEPAESAPQIITSDISERPISIIKHNAEASPLAEIAKTNPDAVTINPQLKDFFSYTIDDICAVRPSANDTAHNIVILLNPPYGKRLAFDAPKLYTKIGQKLNEFKGAVIAILAPKDCTENLLKACPALDSRKNPAARLIETSHGGFSLNAIFARI